MLPYSKTGKIEAGYQYYSYLEDSKYEMQFWNPETKTFYWRDDIYNTSYFRENVNSVYAILSENLRALEIQAGVRGEYTHTRLRSSIAGASRDKRRFEGFPSMHLGYTFPRGHRLLVSYSRPNHPPAAFLHGALYYFPRLLYGRDRQSRYPSRIHPFVRTDLPEKFPGQQRFGDFFPPFAQGQDRTAPGALRGGRHARLVGQRGGTTIRPVWS